ncbi:MAG: sugar phosphate isomerase/epimerase family protein [Granulicella sp.]
MKFGANSFVWTDSFGVKDFDLLPRVKGAGFDGIEIGMLTPTSFPATSFRKEAERVGLKCTSCCVLPKNSSLLSEDKEARRKARSHIENCLKATADAGGKLICGPLYSPVGHFTGVRRTVDEWSRAVEGWQEIAPLAEKVGVQVALEPLNRFETYFLNTVADTADFCDEVDNPNVGILIDTFHANIEEKSIGPAILRAGKHLKHLHSSESDRGIPGTGNVNWQEFFATIKSIHYNDWLVIESFGFSLGELSAAASIWRDLAPIPEAIPFQGVQFLRRMTSQTKIHEVAGSD